MHCKNCKSWDKYDNTCNTVDWEDQYKILKDDEIIMYADAHDDRGLWAGVRTGPMFGCIRFKERVK